MMLHYSVTGEKIEISDFSYQTEQAEDLSENTSQENQTAVSHMPSQSVYLAEQMAMEMIEQGCEDYKKNFGRLSTFAEYVVSADDSHTAPNRTYKNAIISFITLCTRAAIRGGLDVETAYALGNRYLENVESCSSISELMHLNTLMYDDFIQRVKKVKSSGSLSPGVLACLSYVQVHLNERIQLSDIARSVGYSEYYLSRKFRDETGISLNRYIKEKKIERAKLLLQSSHQSVQEIGESLGFCNTSYFIDSFRKVTGMSPKEFREQPPVS